MKKSYYGMADGFEVVRVFNRFKVGDVVVNRHFEGKSDLVVKSVRLVGLRWSRSESCLLPHVRVCAVENDGLGSVESHQDFFSPKI